jgi:L-galactono-1,5-lactonase
MIIDAHCHLWDRIDGRMGSQKVRPLRDGLIQVGRRKVQGMPTWFHDCRNPAGRVLAAMHDAGVSAAVVTQEYLDGNQNDYLLEVKKTYPKSFFVHGLMDFTCPDKLQKEFQRVVRKGFSGIKCPAMFLPKLPEPIRLDDSRLMSIWEQMRAGGMILSIDLAPGDCQVGEMRTILEHFPDLKVAIGHFGMVGHGDWLAQIRLAKYPNVFIECGGIIWLFRNEGPPFRQLQRCIAKAVKLVGADKLMWGSDYPRTLVDFTYRQSLEWAVKECDFFTPAEKTAFLGRNAARLYGFKYSARSLTPHERITEL